MKKSLINVALFFTCSLTFGQVIDNFSDGSFTDNPAWTGDANEFIINNGLLQSNGPNVANSKLYLQTANTKINDAEWSFLINLGFNPTSTTFVRVYLVANQSDLKGTLNGYYIQIGQTNNDFIKLYRQDGTTSSELLTGSSDLGSGNILARIKVRRTSAGEWTLFADPTGGSAYVEQGTVTDQTYTSTSSLGVYCGYSTASRFNLYRFDDFYAGDFVLDTTPPAIESVKVLSDKELLIQFDEALNVSLAQTVSNFSVNNGIGNPLASILQPDQKSVKLTFDTSFGNGTINELSVLNIKDLSNNAITSITKTFSFTAPLFNDVVINELFPDPSPQIGLPSQEFVEIYNKSNKTLNLSGWKLSDATSVATLPSLEISPGDYIILTNSSGATSYGSFGKVIGLSGFPTLNNDKDIIKLVDASGLKIDSVSYNISWYQDDDKAEGGWTLERLNPLIDTNDTLNWRASEDLTGGTPGKQNSVFGKNPDIKPPLLINLTVANNKQLILEFNESLSKEAESTSHYTISNQIGNIVSASLSGEAKFLTLQFETAFTNGLDYKLSISGVKDLADNVMADVQKTFRYFISSPSKYKDIIISEIMADPSPVVQLPEAEYIELFNRTDIPFDLKDWKLSDATSTVKLNSVILLPHEYLILTSTSNASKFLNYGKVLAVSSFPSLNNDGESIVLKNSANELIDSVNYKVTWYKDNDRQDGGWSLELIDPENICGEENNWISADNETGGTPGKQNSVFANKPDLTGPKLLTVTAKPNQLILTFDEKLERSISATSFMISPEVSVRAISFVDHSLKQIRLTLSSSLVTRTAYQLSIHHLRDCAANDIQEGFNQFQFALAEAADQSDLIVNEILFNPKPGGVDFVEIYNQSPKYINLKNYQLANVEEEQIKNGKIISTEDLIISPVSYLVFTSDAALLKNYYLSGQEENFIVVNLPSMSDDQGTIALVDSLHHIIDYLSYSEDYHSPLLKDPEGVSLERISFTSATNDPSNWRSANATTGYATPGYLNSNARPEVAIDNSSIEIIPEIFAPYSGVDNFASIKYRFDQGGYIANVKVYDQQGRSIKQISNNEAIPSAGAFRWDGDHADGSKARSGYYMIWFEVYDLDGNVKTYRKRVVLASAN